MRRGKLGWQVFIAVLAVALAAVLAVGVLTRIAFSSAFSAYVQTMMPSGKGWAWGAFWWRTLPIRRFATA